MKKLKQNTLTWNQRSQKYRKTLNNCKCKLQAWTTKARSYKWA